VKPKKEVFHAFKIYLDTRFKPSRINTQNKNQVVNGYIGVKLKIVNYNTTIDIKLNYNNNITTIYIYIIITTTTTIGGSGDLASSFSIVFNLDWAREAPMVLLLYCYSSLLLLSLLILYYTTFL
jgi:hypothetical protein